MPAQGGTRASRRQRLNCKRKKPPRSPAAAFLIGGGQLRKVVDRDEAFCPWLAWQ